MSRDSRYRCVVVVGLLAVHAGLLLHSLRQHFVVADEAAHVPAGLSHWQTGTFETYRVNPPLPRMLATLPLLLAGARTDGSLSPDVPGHRPEWSAARAFSAANAPRYMDLFWLARLAGVLWSVLGGWLVYQWAGEMYGFRGGLLALTIWCIEPTILTFAQFVVPDLPAAVSGLAAAYAFWHYLRLPSWKRAATAGLLLGIAQLTKSTLLLLYPVFAVLWLTHRRGSATEQSLLTALRQGCLILVLSFFVLNTGYAFRGFGRPLGEYAFVSRLLGGDPTDRAGAYGSSRSGNRFRGCLVETLPMPLPADYVLGIDLQRRDFETGFRSYLRGEMRHRGWWYYYLYAMAVKLPLGILALVIWSACMALARRGTPSGEAVLWLPALTVLAAVSSQTGFNHHMRYVLPCFPFLIVSIGKLAQYWSSSFPLRGMCVPLLVLAAGASSLAIHPHYPAYFNEIAGGPEHGHHHLLDSNIDWGQDLLFLKRWLDEHPQSRPLRLAYYNYIDPRIAGIEYQLPPPGPDGLFCDDWERARTFGPQAGWYAVSVNLVLGLDCFAPDGCGGLRAIRAEQYSYFRQFQPVAKAGYSLFVYQITTEEADAVRARLGLPPLRATPASQKW